MSHISWLHLTWFDFVIIGTVVLSLIVSLFRGFLREALSLVVIILAIILALKFATPLGEYLKGTIHSPMVRYLFGFAAIVIVSLVVGMLINMCVRLLLGKLGLTLVDRLVGVLFGIARGIVVIAAVLLFLNMSSYKKDSWLAQSQLAPSFTPLVSWMQTYLPQQMKQVNDWVDESASKPAAK